MKQENIDILEKHKHHWQTLKNAGYLRGMNVHEKNELLHVMQDEYSPKYLVDLWCGNCVANFVRDLYQRYERYLADQETKPPQVPDKPVFKKQLAILNKEGLIGDFLGTVPAMQQYKQDNEVVFIIHDEAKELADLARLNYFTLSELDKYKDQLDLHELYIEEAYHLAQMSNLYMSQTWFGQLGYVIPEQPPKPELYIKPETTERVDFVVSPFSRCLPDDQKWKKENWVRLFASMPEYTFAVIGHERDLDSDYTANAENVVGIFNKPMNYVANLMMRSTHGLISVVTGTSHLAFALSVKNFLLTNQGAWGTNPEGICMRSNINKLTVNKLKTFILENI